MTFITAKIVPDLDGVACAVAYAEYLNAKGVESKVIFEDHVNFEAKYVSTQLGISNLISDKDAKFNSEDNFILVDFCEKYGLPTFIEPSLVIELIDHREFPAFDYYPNAKWRVEKVGAAATLIAEFYYFDKKIVINPITATLLLCAIYSNTVNFKSENTTFRDIRMRDWLATVASDPKLPEKMFDFKSRYIFENLEEVLGDELKIMINKEGKKIIIFQLETSDSKLILENKQTVEAKLKKLLPEAEIYYLLIQDEQRGNTLILSSDSSLSERLISKGLNLHIHEDIIVLENLMMRKRLTPLIL
jgi:manganese-dependent inorganic pyrophosphatase